MYFNFKKWEDNSSPTIRTIRIVLLVIIIIGTGLLFTQDMWVPKVVDYILE